MAVGALEKNGLAVYEHLAVGKLYLAEAYVDGDYLAAFGGIKSIEIRGLGRPFMRVLDINYGSSRALGLRRCYLAAVGVDKAEIYRAVAFQLEVDGERTIAVIAVKVGSNADILDAVLVAGIEIAIATHAAETEEVLILDVSAVAPAECLEGDEVVLAGLDVGSEVKLVLELRVLAVAHELSVDPQIDIGGDGTEMSNHIFSLPVGGNAHRAAVGTHMVVLDGNVGRIVFVAVAPGVAHVHVDGVTVAVELPYGRHHDFVPAAVVEIGAPEIGWALSCVLHPIEFPFAVKAHVVVARGHIA